MDECGKCHGEVVSDADIKFYELIAKTMRELKRPVRRKICRCHLKQKPLEV